VKVVVIIIVFDIFSTE